MKMIKKAVLAVACSIGISSASGIPTFDFGVISESVIQHNETLTQWHNQMKEMEKQYNAISGMNKWQDVLNSEYFWDFFPKEAKEVASGNVSIDDVLNKINKAINSDTSFEEFKKEELNRVANRAERSKENYKASVERGKEIKEIIKKQGDNTELKDSVDYSNQLQGKMAQIMNELTRLQAENQLYESDNREREKVEDERAKKAMDMTGGAIIYRIR